MVISTEGVCHDTAELRNSNGDRRDARRRRLANVWTMAICHLCTHMHARRLCHQSNEASLPVTSASCRMMGRSMILRCGDWPVAKRPAWSMSVQPTRRSAPRRQDVRQRRRRTPTPARDPASSRPRTVKAPLRLHRAGRIVAFVQWHSDECARHGASCVVLYNCVLFSL